MTSQRLVYTKRVPKAQVFFLQNHTDECQRILSEPFHETTQIDENQSYPTPETCGHPSKLSLIQKLLYDENISLQGEEKLNPTKNDEQGKDFLRQLNSSDSLLDDARKHVLGTSF